MQPDREIKTTLEWPIVATLLGALWFALAEPALAIDFPPAYSGSVVDRAGILHQEAEQDLAVLLDRHEAATGNQIAVLTVSWLLGKTPEGYADTVANLWGLGGDERRGVLVLIAQRENEIWIEIGSGLDTTLSRDMAQVIVEHQILPAFWKGDYGLGALRGVDAIVSVLEGGYVTTPAIGSKGSRMYWIIGGIVGLAVLFSVIAWYRNMRHVSHSLRPAVSGSDHAGDYRFLSDQMRMEVATGQSAAIGGGADGGGGGDG